MESSAPSARRRRRSAAPRSEARSLGGHRVVTSAKRLVLLGRARRDERSEDRDGGRARREGK